MAENISHEMSAGLLDFTEIKTNQTPILESGNEFLISKHYDVTGKKPVQQLIKRVFDILISSISLIVLFPFMLCVGLAIKIESKGPALFKQKRIGLNGKEFLIYKFRSMGTDAHEKEDLIKKQFNEENVIMFKIDNDPRVTKIGKFIRKTSIDELPQLINIIKGDMSIVGPRPRVPKDLNHFKPEHYVFFAAIPGLTGMWQTNGRSEIKDFDQVVEMEFNYIKNWNLFLDFMLVLKTIPVVLKGKGAA